MNLRDLFENNEPGAMAQAVTRRILSTRSDLLSRYGVEAVTQAIDDVTQGDDWEEIGSSDVSAYVRYVEDYLRDHHGSREEMADRRPFAEQGVSENQRRFNNVNDDDLYAVDPRTKEIIAHLGNPYNNRNAVLIKKRRHEEQGHLVMSGMRAKFYRDVDEQGVAEGESQTVEVVISDGTQRQRRRVRVSPNTRNVEAAVLKYYAKVGLPVVSINGKPVRAAMAEGDDNTCPECGGPIFKSRFMAEEQDACYHKVRSRYKVWPSAYASGALVQCRKKGAANWGTGGKKS